MSLASVQSIPLWRAKKYRLGGFSTHWPICFADSLEPHLQEHWSTVTVYCFCPCGCRLNLILDGIQQLFDEILKAWAAFLYQRGKISWWKVIFPSMWLSTKCLNTSFKKHPDGCFAKRNNIYYVLRTHHNGKTPWKLTRKMDCQKMQLCSLRTYHLNIIIQNWSSIVKNHNKEVKCFKSFHTHTW